MKSRLLLILTLCLSFSIIGCKSNSDTTPPPTTTYLSCNFQAEYKYNLDVDPGNDFIGEDVTEKMTITSSTCAGVSAGNIYSETVNWISRNNNTMTFSSSGENGVELTDLSISGTTFDDYNSNFCNDYGENISISIISSTINSSQNLIQLTADYSVTGNGCAATTEDNNYVHTELKGTWRSACIDGAIYWMAYYHNAVVKMKYIYSTTDCQADADMYIEWNGPTNIREVVSGSTKQIDHSYQNFYVKVFDTDVKNDFNTNTMCGISTWTTDVDINVKGKDCDFTSLGITDSETFSSTYTREFDIFNITGSNLNLGDPLTGDKSSSANRPSSLDTENDYTMYNGYYVIPTWAK